MTPEPPVEPLGRLAGTWTTEATHPAFPGLIIPGTADIEWLEGKRFLILRSRTGHPSFPSSMSVIGITGRDGVDSATEAAADSRLRCPWFLSTVPRHLCRRWQYHQRSLGALQRRCELEQRSRHHLSPLAVNSRPKRAQGSSEDAT